MVRFDEIYIHIFTSKRETLDVPFLRDLQLLLGDDPIQEYRDVFVECLNYPVITYLPNSKKIWIKEFKYNFDSYNKCVTNSGLIEQFIKLNYGEFHL